MTTLREAAQQALKALGLWATGRDMDAVALNDLIFRLEAALAESVQEPVAWADMAVRGEDKGLSWTPGHFHKTPLYTAPPQRKPLTEEDVERLIYENTKINPNVADDRELLGYIVNAARAIERAHGVGEKE